MYTEILRIIEGGLSKDSQKVYNYAKILADKMSRDGETKMSKMILDSLERRYTSMLSLDELSSTPVDAESRMSIVDVYCPTENEIKPILPELTAHKVDDFINMIKHQTFIKMVLSSATLLCCMVCLVAVRVLLRSILLSR